MKTWSELNIIIPSSGGAERYTTCPQPDCSRSRKKKNAKCLSVNVDKEVWVCHHCGWRGSLKQGEQGRPQADRWKPQVYARPVYAVPPTPSDQLVAFFEERGISPAILELYKVSLGIEWMPVSEDRVPVIQFPYFRGEEIINIKSRSLIGKEFRQTADAEKILYGLNDIEGSVYAIFVEGECDKLALAEAGELRVVSVPDGAPAANAKPSAKKFEYLENCQSYLDPLTQIVLAVDNDEPGKALERELLRRLGPERCWLVEWPEGIKDANQMLLEHGAEALREAIARARPTPIEHVLRVQDLATALVDYYHNGRQRGLSTGWPALDQFFTISPGQFTSITGIPSHGKALDIRTPIPTPVGWKSMGDLKVGDYVFDERGRACTIVAATEVMHNRPCYEIVFSDQTKVVCDAEHSWLTSSGQDRRSARMAKRNSRTAARPVALRGNDQSWKRSFPSVKTTSEIAKTVIDEARGDDGLNHQVVLCQPVEYERSRLPIAPYVLGAWLGDGTSGHGGFTCNDQEIIDRITACGYRVVKWGGVYDYGITGLKVQLRKLCLLNNKHIPQRYLQSSFSQRLDLLRGLLDTDGFCDKRGTVEFGNTNQLLAEQVKELASSLGMVVHWCETRATIQGKDCGPFYRLAIKTDLIVFHLSRKANRQKPQSKNMNRRIVSCLEVESVPVRCIQVDSASHLYLCTEAFIPTHNSEFLDALMINMMSLHGSVFAIYSPENQPTEHHLAKLAEKIEGLPFLPGQTERMSPDQLFHAINWLEANLFIIDAPEPLSVDELLEKARALVLQKGITHLIIDPWNELDHARPERETETDYISKCLSKMKRFGRRHAVHTFCVAHPVKLVRDKNGNYPVPTPYDISGSAHWRNKPDNCLTIWRNTQNDFHYSEAHMMKVRWKQNGRIGVTAFQWNPICGRYSETALLDNQHS